MECVLTKENVESAHDVVHVYGHEALPIGVAGNEPPSWLVGSLEWGG